MSQENVKIVQAIFKAWNDGDMDAFRELHDPDIIMRMPADFPEPGPFVGRVAIMRQFEQMRETWDADTLEAISDFIDIADHVVVRFIWSGAGHGPEANLEATAVYSVRKGRTIGLAYFWDHAEALEAAGLPEEAMAQVNVDVAGQVMDAVAQRDVSRLIALTDPDVGWHSFFALGEGEGVYRGHDRVQQYVSDLNDAWEIVRPEVDDTLEVGNLVVLVGRLHCRGKGSGVETEAPAGWVLTFRAGRVLYMRAFQEPEKALKAVGLSEQASRQAAGGLLGMS